VKTQYGFHIIKVLEKETAHTKPFEEVKDSIRAPLMLAKADDQASRIADDLAKAVRKSNKTPLSQLASEISLASRSNQAGCPRRSAARARQFPGNQKTPFSAARRRSKPAGFAPTAVT